MRTVCPWQNLIAFFTRMEADLWLQAWRDVCIEQRDQTDHAGQ